MFMCAQWILRTVGHIVVPLVDLQSMTNSISKNDAKYKHESISKNYIFICTCITAVLKAYIITSEPDNFLMKNNDHPQFRLFSYSNIHVTS